MAEPDSDSSFDADELDRAMSEIEADDEPAAEDVPTLTADEAQYDRDEDGNLKPITEVIETENGPRAIKLKPLVATELMTLQDRYGGKDDLPPSAIFELLNEYILEPAGVQWGETSKLQATMSAIEVLFGQFTDETDDLKDAVGEELAERDDGAAGN